jgi:hypothetical protein
MQENARLDQVWLAKKREVKTRDNIINLAQATQVAQVAQVSCSGLGPVNWAVGEPRVIGA